MAAKSQVWRKVSVFANSSSVSPGKATMRSVVMAQPGKYCRSRRTLSRYRAVSYRRFIRWSTVSHPDWRERWNWGQRLAKPWSLRHSASSMMRGSREPEADAGLRNGGQDGLEQVAQGAAVVPFRAPGGNLDAGDDDLPVALLGQGLGPGPRHLPGAASAPGPGEGVNA